MALEESGRPMGHVKTARHEDPARKPLSPVDYTVGWICAIPYELEAARALLDERHPDLEVQAKHDENIYTLGNIGAHNVTITCLAEYGMKNAAIAAKSMQSTFPNLRFGLMVGTGGGVPSEEHDIRLGDIVVSMPSEQGGGVIQYDLGRAEVEGFRRLGCLNKPPTLLRTAIAGLRATRSLGREIAVIANNAFKDCQDVDEEWNFGFPKMAKDHLFRTDFVHVEKGASCDACIKAGDNAVVTRFQRRSTLPRIHYGNIASGNSVIGDAAQRDHLAERDNIICFDMEAAGLMDDFPCLVIRGISNYADSHGNCEWQRYAAAIAAAYAKKLLLTIPSRAVEQAELIRGIAKSTVEILIKSNADPNTKDRAVLANGTSVDLPDEEWKDLRAGLELQPGIRRVIEHKGSL